MMLATSIIIADMIVISASVWVNGFMIIYFYINILNNPNLSALDIRCFLQGQSVA